MPSTRLHALSARRRGADAPTMPFAGLAESTGAVWLLGRRRLAIGEGALWGAPLSHVGAYRREHGHALTKALKASSAVRSCSSSGWSSIYFTKTFKPSPVVTPLGKQTTPHPGRLHIKPSTIPMQNPASRPLASRPQNIRADDGAEDQGLHEVHRRCRLLAIADSLTRFSG